MKLIDSENEIALAWFEAVKYLVDVQNHEEFNLILHIENPQTLSIKSKEIFEKYDALLRQNDNSIMTVADTIFPSRMYIKNSKDWNKMRKQYLDEYDLSIGKHSSNSWGTYAYRLLFRELIDGTKIDPLGTIIEKINKWIHEIDKPFKACYELNLIDESLDASIYNAKDRNRAYGGPCMSHMSFKVDANKKLHATVMYRSHYYLERALGNLFGISRLQKALCEQVNLEPGPITCISTYAHLDTGKGKSGLTLKDLDRFVTEIEGKQGSLL